MCNRVGVIPLGRFFSYQRWNFLHVIIMGSHENIASLLAFSHFRGIRRTQRIWFFFFFQIRHQNAGRALRLNEGYIWIYLKRGCFCVTKNFFLKSSQTWKKFPFLLLILLFTALWQIQAAGCSLREFWVKVSLPLFSRAYYLAPLLWRPGKWFSVRYCFKEYNWNRIFKQWFYINSLDTSNVTTVHQGISH